MPSASRSADRSRVRNLVLLGIGLLFVAIGIGMIVAGADGGVATTAFFGACAAVAVWQLRPGLLETEARSPEALLAQYPGPVVLRASVRKLLFLAAFSAVFGGVMLWTLLHDPLPLAGQMVLWPGVVLFLGGAAFLILLAVRGSALHLDEAGLAIVQIGRARRARWHDTSGFAATTVKGTVQRMVVFDDASLGDTRIVAMNRRLTGRDTGLPDSYGLDPDVLADVLAAWRTRAVRDDAERC